MELEEPLKIEVILRSGVTHHLVGIPYLTDAKIGMNVNPVKRGKPVKPTSFNSNSFLPCLDLTASGIHAMDHLELRDCEWMILGEFDMELVVVPGIVVPWRFWS